MNIPVRKFALDLSQEKDRELLKEELVRLKPQVKFLVNAAGFGKIGNVCDLPEKDQTGMVTGKLYGPDCCYHHGPSFYAAKQLSRSLPPAQPFCLSLALQYMQHQRPMC